MENRKKFTFDVARFTSLIGLVALLIVSSFLSSAFLNPVNVLNVLRQVVPNGIAACGVTLIIISGGIDLSIGSVFALSGVSAALLIPNMPWPIAILLIMIGGFGIGTLHGLLITKLNVPPFIVTLAGLTVYRGAAMAVTGAANLPVTDKSFSTALGSGTVPAKVVMIILCFCALGVLSVFTRMIKKQRMGKTKAAVILVLSLVGLTYLAFLVSSVGSLSIQIIIYMAVLILTLFLLNKTVLGRHIYAVGGSYLSTKMAGIKADNVLIKTYAFGSFCAVLSGVLITAKLQSGMPSAGVNGELDAIASAVIGGASLSGGYGKLTGTIIGVLLIGVLNNMLSLLNISSDLQSIFKGLIILGAVIIDMKFKK